MLYEVITGTTELAAASFSNSIFIVGMLLGMGVCMGLTPLVGRFFSQKNDGELGAYLKNGLFVYAVLAMAISLIMVGVAFLLGRMGQPEEVSALAFPYFLVLVASIIP